MNRVEVAAVLGQHATEVKDETAASVVAVLAFVDEGVVIGSWCPDVETLVFLLERALRDIARSPRIIDKRRVVD